MGRPMTCTSENPYFSLTSLTISICGEISSCIVSNVQYILNLMLNLPYIVHNLPLHEVVAAVSRRCIVTVRADRMIIGIIMVLYILLK